MTDKNVCPVCGKSTIKPCVHYDDGTALYFHAPEHRDKPIPHWVMANICGPVAENDEDEDK